MKKNLLAAITIQFMTFNCKTRHSPRPICRPQPSAQPSSLITSDFFSPPISSHSLAPTPSAAVRAIPRTHFPSAAVPPAKLADFQRLLLPTHFQPLPCTQAVRSRPRNSPRPICRPQPSAQPSSLITSDFFSPPISSHSLAPRPSAAVRAIPRTHFPSAAVPPAKLADFQRLLLPTHFQPLPCTQAVRSRPRNSPHPFAVRSRPPSQARWFPAASSPHPFPATPLHPGRPQPSAQFSPPICRPQPSAQPARSSPAASSPHPFPPAPLHPRRRQPVAQFRTHCPSAAVRAAKLAHHQRLQRLLLPTHFQPLPCTQHPRRPQPCAQFRTHFPSAAVRAAKLAHHQRLLLPTHFQPLRTHAVRSRPAASSPHPFPATLAPTPSAAVRAAKLADLQRLLFPFILFPSFPFLSLPFPSFPFLPFLSLPFSFLSHPFPFLSLPFPSFPFLSLPFPSFPFLSLPFPSFPILSLAPTQSAPPFKPARSPTRLKD